MKNIINYLPYCIAIVLQFIIPSYFLIVLLTVLIGIISAFFIKRRRVFIRSFSLTFLIFMLVFILYQSRIVYMGDVIASIGLPSITLYILFPLFTALNVSILFYTGYVLGTLFSKKTSQTILQRE